MRVAFADPQGPRRIRLVPFAPPVALFVLACAAPFWDATTSLLVAVLAFALFHLAGILPLRQKRLRAADLVCGPGYVDVRNAGTRNQRIHARSISGATTARTRRGVLFTLQHRRRDQPLEIEAESDADADKIRFALGIGHGGFGSVGWHTVPSSSTKTAFTGRLLTFLFGSFVAGIGLLVSAEAAGTVALMCAQFAIITFVLGLAGWLGRKAPPDVQMTTAGLELQTAEGRFRVPYSHVLGIERGEGFLAFRVPPPYNLVQVRTTGILRGLGLTPVDKEALIEQIMSASARARGLGRPKDDVSGRVDVLRRHGEPPRAYLARLDMMGHMLESAVAGYRGNTLDAEDLWTIFEDPEADAELRAAAARVLRHVPAPNVRPRIDATLAAVRDEITEKRLRIAVETDVERASRELAALDAEEELAGSAGGYPGAGRGMRPRMRA